MHRGRRTAWDAVTGGLKFTYDVNDDATVYFGYDRGFKAGGFDSVGQGATNDAFIVKETV